MAQTIEKTDKTWKGLQLIAGLILLLGIGGCMTGDFGSGCGLVFLGLVMCMAASFGAWWTNG